MSLLEEDLSPATKEHASIKHAAGLMREKNNSNEKGQVSFDCNIHSCGVADTSFDAADIGCDEDDSDTKNGKNGGHVASTELITSPPCGKREEAAAATGTGEDIRPETTCAAGLVVETRKADGKGQVSLERNIHSYGAAEVASFNAADGGCEEEGDDDN